MRPEQILEVAVSLSVQAFALILVTFVIGLLTRSADVRCRLWTVCFTLLLIIGVFGLMLPHWRPVRTAALLDRVDIIRIGRWEEQAGTAIGIIWLIGAVTSLLLLLGGLIANRLRLQACQPVSAPELDEAATADRRFATWRRPVQFFRGDLIATPSCWQTHTPTILLPRSFFWLDPVHRRFIVRHELEHLAGGHALQVVIGRLAAVLFWFHPAVWWASRHAALMREFACDEHCVRDRYEILDYLRGLLAIAEGVGTDVRRGSCLHFAWGTTVMSRRTERLLWLAQRPDTPSSWRSAADRCLWGALILLGLTVSAVWLPANVLASPHSDWSPWPAWTATVLHDAGITVRDHEVYDRSTRVHELQEHTH